MAKYGPASITVEYDNLGGTPVDISQYVQEINGVSIQQILEEAHSFGDSWEEHLPVGVGRPPNLTLGGLYDDTASSGPDALFADRIPEGPSDSARTLTITWGGSKTTSFETHLASYERVADRNALTRWTAGLQGTGAVTEA